MKNNSEIPAVIRDLASQWGRIGGSVKSPAKTAACRKNARKPRQNKRKKINMKSTQENLNNGNCTICYTYDRYPATYSRKSPKVVKVHVDNIINPPVLFSLRKNGKYVAKGTHADGVPYLMLGRIINYQSPEA